MKEILIISLYFWVFVLCIFPPKYFFENWFRKKEISGNCVTVNHEWFCHFSIDGNGTRVTHWRHTLFWIAAFDRWMYWKKFKLKCPYLEMYMFYRYSNNCSIFLLLIYNVLHVLKIKCTCRWKILDKFPLISISIFFLPWMIGWKSDH